jgi:hypothetical protein
MTLYVHISHERLASMDQVTPRFKPPRSPHKVKRERARDRRPGMDPEHVRNVAKLPSCISGKKPCDPHHLKKKDERGVSLKATDRWCVPLTRDEHMEIERMGSRREVEWFKAKGIDDPFGLAAALWFNRGDLETMELVVRTHRGKP